MRQLPGKSCGYLFTAVSGFRQMALFQDGTYWEVNDDRDRCVNAELLFQHQDAMILGIAHEHISLTIHRNAMRPAKR